MFNRKFKDKNEVFDYLRAKTDEFIKNMCRVIERRFNKYYAEPADVTKAVKSIVDNMDEKYSGEHREPKHIDASEIKSGDMMIAAALRRKDIHVEVDKEELVKARWVDVDDELPTEEELYFILTDDHLIKGYAWFGIQEEGDTEPRFDVWYAMCGNKDNPPKVKYWLKDNHWGLVYDFKKKAGEL